MTRRKTKPTVCPIHHTQTGPLGSYGFQYSTGCPECRKEAAERTHGIWANLPDFPHLSTRVTTRDGLDVVGGGKCDKCGKDTISTVSYETDFDQGFELCLGCLEELQGILRKAILDSKLQALAKDE